MTDIQETQQILEVLGKINERLAKIETKLEYQAKMDTQSFNVIEKNEEYCKRNYDKLIEDHEERIVVMESKPGKRWDLVGTIIITSGINSLIFYLTR